MKKKLVIAVSSICLVMVMLMVGVWALKTVNFSVGGNISFSATGINATISKGTLAGGSWVTSTDADSKMQEIVLNTDKTLSQIETEFQSWSGLNLLFNENGDDVTITFAIKNDSKTANDNVSVFVTVGGGTMKNATARIDKSAVLIAPDTTETFTITFSVTDKTANASLTGFQIVFDMAMYDSTPKATTEYDNLTFGFTDSNDGVYVVQKSSNKPTGNLVIPEKVLVLNETSGEYEEYSVKLIRDEAFDGCTGLTGVIIPSSVTGINIYAFSGCTGLTDVIIPSSVTNISSSAFDGCSSLKSIVVDENNGVYDSRDNCNAIIKTATNQLMVGCKNTVIPSTVTSIDFNAFRRCSGLKSIAIPQGVTSIGDMTFVYCTGLESVTIPVSVTEIGYGAFLDCTNLTDVYYTGTEEEWNAITIDSDNDALTSATIHYNYVAE